MTTRPFTITSIHIPDPSRYGNARRTVAMMRGIVIALILCVLAIPFVTEAEAGTLPQDTSKQITTLRQQAAAGSAIAQFRLGEAFQRGQHVPQDMTTAHHYYSLAATQGHIRAQFRLGFLYERGLGVKQNFATAARFYHQAAHHNHPVAQHNLAILFAHGRGVKRNLQHAYGWARMAEINARQISTHPTRSHKPLSADFHAKLDKLLSRLRTRLSDGQITRAEWHIQLASGIPT
ncbi:tetratricopeptide repeat protein [Candidatus Puniceispirillum marinum]|uniref:Sel1-like repeat protein n=1 Tax=Puniceispirillum marinum (strain IMCC1322) TaxID=488538 RepID=D5BNI5_PUNMI|nr:tetratricopeptide repeat protein [Candidatus Puniceispirillum marinum]ADE38252.1 Sel1-like repeat protein [Candidatus Puniceispirillum marinum IMCC1322]